MSIIDSLSSSGWEAFTMEGGTKFPPPRGWTGYSKDISEDMVFEEMEKEAEGNKNIAVSLPEGVVGIDIDSSSTQEQKAIRASAVEGWRVSSSDGLERFTAFFSLPYGVSVEDLRNIPGVDLISSTHRYSILHGVHPSTRPYRLFSPAGIEISIEEFPAPDELPDLPKDIITLMKRDAETVKPRRTPRKGIESSKWRDTPEYNGNPCNTAQRALQRGMEGFTGGDRHGTLIKAAYTLCSLNEKGHSIGNLPHVLIERFVELTGEERRGEAYNAIQIIGEAHESACDCYSSYSPDGYFIDKNLLESVGVERGEIESEVFIREMGLFFENEKQRKKFREITAKNIMIDLYRKQSNRVEAEDKYTSIQRRRHSTEGSTTRLMEAIKAYSITDREERILFLVGLGYTDSEIASKISVSRKTISKEKKTIRERGRK